MSQTLKNNAFHILGLDTSASEKEIFKRSKEIINRLNADDTPEYDLDIGVFNHFRTESTVRDALQKLQAPKKRIIEYFFWFQISDGIDEKVVKLLKEKDYLRAIKVWEEVCEGQSTKAYFYKKNLAILYCLGLSIDDNSEYLKNSLEAWKDLINSDKFWKSFSKVYKLHDEQTASDDIILDFKKHVVEYLSDIYTELHDVHKNTDYVNEFHKVFSTKGEKIEKNVLQPAFEAISKAVIDLEAMEVSKDNIFDEEESKLIKSCVQRVQEELNKLIDLGLYDDSQTKIMRDRSANALRTIVLDLHNNLSELDKSSGLLEVAIQLAGTESLKNKLTTELNQIRENIKDDNESSLSIEVPGTFGGGTVLFKNSYIEYNNKRIFYKDAVSLSYHAISQSYSFVPISQTFYYKVASMNQTISFSFGTSLNIGKEAKTEVFGKLAVLSEALIEPHIIRKMVDQIFKQQLPIKIGNIEFTHEGYSFIRHRIFREGVKNMVLWTDTVYVPKFDSGQVILWKDTNGASEIFISEPMSTPNAVIIPGLVKACANR